MRHIIDETYCRNLLARETVYEEPSAGGGLGRWEPGYAKTRSYFYDSYARPVVIHESDNTGWQSTYTYSYDFLGNILQKTEEHRSSEGFNNLTCGYTYDSRGRMTSLTRTVNGQEMTPITYIYDDFGRLEVKDFLGRGNQFYGYDMRGNLLFNASARNGEEIFRQTISYHSPLLPSSTPLFGGFISEITEKHVGNPLYATSYRYDHLGRMTGLSKTEDGDIPSYDWSETSVTYDRNGNLTSIINEGGLPNQVTHYNLDGNRLVSSGSLTGESALYQYYPDGNLKVDSKRNLQFGYNLLNLPQVVTSVGGGTHWARYAYLADGTKMYRKDMHHDGHVYRGSFVYRLEGGVQRLESIGYEEGRILATGHNDWGTAEEFIDTWHVTDHLGNVRAVVDITDSGESVEDVMSLVLEQNDYRPFGERIDDERMEADGENRYRFAGKEEQAFLDGVYSDFGARYHSSDIQRWTTPDPLSEKYYDISPYAFCNNNPINFVDPDGAKIQFYEVADYTGTIPDYSYSLPIYDYETGDYSILGYYDKDGNLVGYGASRNGRLEYVMDDVNDLVRFVENLGTYSLASDLFYMNGGPSDGAIEIITGNSRRGMMKMWRDALRDPVYYLYAASALGTAFLIAPNYNKIYFGQNPNQIYHTFRHIDRLGLSRTQVKMAILDDLKHISTTVQPETSINRVICVNGKNLQYTAYRFSNNNINVGRIHEK